MDILVKEIQNFRILKGILVSWKNTISNSIFKRVNFKFSKASFSSATTIQSSGSLSKYPPSQNLRLWRLSPPWIASSQSRTNAERYAFLPSIAAACAGFSPEKPSPTWMLRWRRNLATRTPPSQTTSLWPPTPKLATYSWRCSSPPKTTAARFSLPMTCGDF